MAESCFGGSESQRETKGIKGAGALVSSEFTGLIRDRRAILSRKDSRILKKQHTSGCDREGMRAQQRV